MKSTNIFVFSTCKCTFFYHSSIKIQTLNYMNMLQIMKIEQTNFPKCVKSYYQKYQLLLTF